MERQIKAVSGNREPLIDVAAPPKSKDSLIWYLVALGLIVWQGWMTLTLFGPDHPWQRLCDDQPIVSGRHALHFYHGTLGAQSLRDRGRLSCYDPAFQAGYPKTPVFDAGSRPAELFLTLVGGRFKPEAYKIGLAICCAAVPIFLWGAARGMGFDRATCALACILGSLVHWGGPGRPRYIGVPGKIPSRAGFEGMVWVSCCGQLRVVCRARSFLQSAAALPPLLFHGRAETRLVLAYGSCEQPGRTGVA